MATEYRLLLVSRQDAALKPLLQHPRLNVATVASVREAMQICQQFTPDLVVLDSNLQDMNIMDACRTFKAHQTIAAIPLLVLAQSPEMEAKAYGSGAGTVLVMPQKADALQTKILRMIAGEPEPEEKSVSMPAAPTQKKPPLVLGLAMILVALLFAVYIFSDHNPKSELPADVALALQTPLPVSAIKARDNRLFIYVSPEWNAIDELQKEDLLRRTGEELATKPYERFVVVGIDGRIIASGNRGAVLHSMQP